MTTRFFRVTPQDTLFFRDGRPYEQQDDGLAHAHSLFPPHPTTLTGALRAAIARANGWDGRNEWDSYLIGVLGNGPDMADASLQFGPPLLLRGTNTSGEWEPLFPAPLTLSYGTKPGTGERYYTRLRPGEVAVECDLGTVRLPMRPSLPEGFEPSKSALKPGELWLSRQGMELACGSKPLGGDFGAHVIDAKDLWADEPRVGLELSADTRTAVRGRLYAPVHVRLKDGVALGQSADGMPADWHEPSAPVPLGGEHRFAHVETVPSPTMPAPVYGPLNGGRHRISVTLLSPAFADEAWLTAGGEPVPGARLVSAVLGDLLPIGGWDSRKGARGPRPLRPALPAGSTWFLEVEPAALDALRRGIGSKSDTCHGFGAVLLGGWPEGGT